MNPIEVIFSGLAYSFSLESLKMCLIFCSHLLENQLRYKINIKKKYYKHVENIEITRKRKKERSIIRCLLGQLKQIRKTVDCLQPPFSLKIRRVFIP